MTEPNQLETAMPAPEARRLTCEGLLRHHFWGDYSCCVVLELASPTDAAAAAAILGAADWKQLANEKDKHCIRALLDSDKLDALKEHFAAAGTPASEIDKVDSLAKSVDYGEPFTAQI